VYIVASFQSTAQQTAGGKERWGSLLSFPFKTPQSSLGSNTDTVTYVHFGIQPGPDGPRLSSLKVAFLRQHFHGYSVSTVGL
jgi:hypothetical protein